MTPQEFHTIIDAIDRKIKQHQDNLALWRSGYLTPTEPDAEERAETIEGLKGALYALADIKGEIIRRLA